MTKRIEETSSEYYHRYKANFIQRHGREEWLKRRREIQRRYVEKHREEVNRKHREWEKKNKEKVKKWKRDYKEKLRLQVLNHYSNGKMECACCGENHIEFLTIDHIHGEGRKHFREVGRGYQFYRWLIKNNFPEGFRILCYNCNCSIGHRGYCPHQKERIA